MGDPVNLKFRNKPVNNTTGLISFGMALGGTSLLGGLVYFCYFLVMKNYAKNSFPMISTGLALIVTCVLLVAALVVGIKSIMKRPDQPAWSVAATILSGFSLISFIGLSILGIVSGLS